MKEEGRRPWLAGDGFNFVDYQFQGPRLYLTVKVCCVCRPLQSSIGSSIGPSTWIEFHYWGMWYSRSLGILKPLELCLAKCSQKKKLEVEIGKGSLAKRRDRIVGFSLYGF